MNPFRIPILFLLAILFLLCGCEALNRPVDNSAAQQRAADAEALVAKVQGYITTLTEQLDAAKAYIVAQDGRIAEARAVAEASQSDAARAVVLALEQLRDRAAETVPKLQDALAAAAKGLPEVQAMATAIRTEADKLPAGGTSPLWYVLGMALLPVVIKGTQVATAGIPGVGPVVSGLAETAITGLWNTLATSRQKARDAEVEARSKALDHQLQVTNALVAVAGEKAEPILEAAKASQKAAGVHATLEPLVAALEAKG